MKQTPTLSNEPGAVQSQGADRLDQVLCVRAVAKLMDLIHQALRIRPVAEVLEFGDDLLRIATTLGFVNLGGNLRRPAPFGHVYTFLEREVFLTQGSIAGPGGLRATNRFADNPPTLMGAKAYPNGVKPGGGGLHNATVRER